LGLLSRWFGGKRAPDVAPPASGTLPLAMTLPAPGAPPPPATRAAALELDLAERDLRIEALLVEVAAAKEGAKAGADAASAARVAALLKRLAPLLSQADAMRHFAGGAQGVRVEDALTLLGKIEKVLAEEGLQRIGESGVDSVFDPRLHQRLSGGDVNDGDPVTIRFPGYRLGETVLSKAMVSRWDIA
jgi:molecular chaperone GrpE (heat shock protein)